MTTILDPLHLPLHGSRLIEASAGTGKTWTLAALREWYDHSDILIPDEPGPNAGAAEGGEGGVIAEQAEVFLDFAGQAVTAGPLSRNAVGRLLQPQDPRPSRAQTGPRCRRHG